MKAHAGVRQYANNSLLSAKNEKLGLDIDKKMDKWKDYVKDLFAGNRRLKPNMQNISTGTLIRLIKVEKDIKTAIRTRKTLQIRIQYQQK